MEEYDHTVQLLKACHTEEDQELFFFISEAGHRIMDLSYRKIA